jgi:hypothetical protein
MATVTPPTNILRTRRRVVLPSLIGIPRFRISLTRTVPDCGARVGARRTPSQGRPYFEVSRGRRPARQASLLARLLHAASAIGWAQRGGRRLAQPAATHPEVPRFPIGVRIG